MKFLIVLALFAASCGIQFSRPEAEQWQPGAIEWDHMPLTVYWDRQEFPDYNEGIDAAVALWNEEIGCEVFRPTTSPVADVSIGSRDSLACGKPVVTSKNAWAFTAYCQTTAEIQFRQLGDVQTMYVVDQHELGHVLGLAHDYGGIMKPQVGEFDLPRLLIPDSDDVSRLRKKYCQ